VDSRLSRLVREYQRGSWITPELSMQEVTWSETVIEGGRPVRVKLEQPSSRLEYYKDTFVLAFPAINAENGPVKEIINDWKAKSNFPRSGKFNPDIELDDSIENFKIADSAVDPERVIDISSNMNSQGELQWEAPEGRWTIIRFGHTTTGVTNHPAEGKGLGLECDKYSRKAFDFHFNYIIDNLLPGLAPLAEKGRLGMLIDSYEVDLQNWTENMPQEFLTRTGYDIVRYMPVFTGRVVGNKNITERFLWDFRRICADMMAENYQGRFTQLCREHNIISYTEPYNRSPFEQMQAGAEMDINMGEFWIRSSHFCHSLKVASSIQNMNGRQIVGAESFTGRPYYSRWQEYPFAMKAQGDFMYTRGLNRFIFHRYAHQPHPTAVPGMTMGQWGFHFDRTNTWFYQGKKWLEYVSRCQYILQQGVFSGDVICFTGQEAPGKDISMGELIPDLPYGYDFQFANIDIVMERMTIRKGNIVLPDGMSFRLMVLPSGKYMTTDAARRLAELVKRGMILVGERPVSSPSLSDFTRNESEFQKLIEELWGPVASATKDRRVGRGRVFAGLSVKEVLNILDIRPDFRYTSESGDAPVNYIHRKIDGKEVYFIANRRRFRENIVCTFRVAGMEPELWNAVTGEITALSLYDTDGVTTTFPLQLDPGGSAFVVFRSPISERRIISVSKNRKIILSTENFAPRDSDFNKRTINNFTVSLWVKPETEDLLPKTTGPASPSSRPLACYPVDPPAGNLLYGEGHAAFCLLVARNGVVVFEKEDTIPSAVMIVPMPISGWTHFTVVYKDGQPLLYVNGQFIKKGTKSGMLIHPAIGESYRNEKLYYYDGDLTRPKVFDTSLTESQIVELFKEGMPAPVNDVCIEPVAGKTASFKFWQNGNYTINESTGISNDITVTEINTPVELKGEWEVLFPAGLGAPGKIKLPVLSSLHLHEEDGVKYFSGTASYSRKFNIDPSYISDGKRICLDLGRIAVIAEVMVNGKEQGIIWKPPYCIDITEAVKTGDNDLVIKVTNLWPNRLIGDEQLPAENEYGKFGDNGAAIIKLPEWYQQGKPKPGGGRITFTTWKHFEKSAPLLESGLVGPVVIRSSVVKPVLS
jgi:hypothetical protein